MTKSKVDGHNVLYHFLQKELQEADYWLFQMMVARLVASLAIWFSPDTYRAMPILLPFAVRDPDARGNKPQGLRDQWGSPNPDGYFRDDNSLVKGLPRALSIESPRPIYGRRTLGNGFVASHVWRELLPSSAEIRLASRHPLTYSFVPNLVWLPSQVAKLTDRDGSFAQQYLQAISSALYRRVEIDGPLSVYAERAWELLPSPVFPEQGLPSKESMSFFSHDDAFILGRRETLEGVAAAFTQVVSGGSVEGKVVSSRYGAGIGSLLPGSAARMAEFLEGYSAALDASGTYQPNP